MKKTAAVILVCIMVLLVGASFAAQPDQKATVMLEGFDDLTEAIPAFIAIIAMPFLYSISEGIAMGVISYVAIQILSGKAKEKKISVIMYILAVLFILKYLLL